MPVWWLPAGLSDIRILRAWEKNYKVTTVCDFNLTDVKRFLTSWHLMVAVGQQGPGHSSEVYAKDQTRQLMEAIQNNDRIRELAINPLMLTVIALVHRDRVKLPDRRAELYAEAVDVLLGKWDEARDVKEIDILEHKPFDTGDKRFGTSKHRACHARESAKRDLLGGPASASIDDV